MTGIRGLKRRLSSAAAALALALAAGRAFAGPVAVRVEVPAAGTNLPVAVLPVGVQGLGESLLSGPMLVAPGPTLLLPAPVVQAPTPSAKLIPAFAVKDAAPSAEVSAAQVAAGAVPDVPAGVVQEAAPASVVAPPSSLSGQEASSPEGENGRKGGKLRRLLGSLAKKLRSGTLFEDDARAAALGYKQELANLDPDAAERCVRDPRMRRLLSSDPGAAAATLAKAYALSDLAELVDEMSKPGRLHEALGLRLQREGSLEGLGLDDEASLLAWVRRYRPQRERRVRAAVLAWDTLSPEQQESLGPGEESWALRQLKDRDLFRWSERESERLQSTPVPEDAHGWRVFMHAFKEAFRGLAPQKRWILWEHMNRSRPVVLARVELRRLLSRGEDARAREALEGLDRLGWETPAVQLEYLQALSDAGKSPAFSRRLVKAIERERPSREGEGFGGREELPFGVLKALDKELQGTRHGRVRSPLGGVRLAELDGALADYSEATGLIRFDRKSVESWLRVHGFDARALDENPGVQRALARWLASSFVHEGTHHEQVRRTDARALVRLYSQEEEIEAMATESLFALEKAEGKGYPEEAMELSEPLVRMLRAGFGELVSQVRMAYSGVPSLRSVLAVRLAHVARLSAQIEWELAGRGVFAALKRALMRFLLGFQFIVVDQDFKIDWICAFSPDYKPLRTNALMRDYTVDWALETIRMEEESRARILEGVRRLP
ncbi:MAG: hypothetical protein WC969_11030 [Elusimicrobiota bacterium]|jgi:hypothetical protein